MSYFTHISINNSVMDIALGNVPGYTADRKFGRNDDIDAGDTASIWEFGGVDKAAETYTFSSTADIDSISSSSASDTVDITIIGLDANWDEVTQTITLNGQTRVALTTTLLRVNRAYNANGTDLVGNVYVYVNGTITAGVPNTATDVRGYISSGRQQTLQAIYSVPRNKTMLVMGSEASLVGRKDSSVTVSVCIRAYQSVFLIKRTFDLISTGSSMLMHTLPVPLAVPGRSDINIEATADTADSGVSYAWSLVLVDD